MTTASVPEVNALDNLHQTMKEFQPPSKRQMALWIAGVVVGVSLLLGMIVSVVVLTRVDARTAQTPGQYQQLHHDLVKLKQLAKQDVSNNPAAQATYLQIESQIKSLCSTVPNCNWSTISK